MNEEEHKRYAAHHLPLVDENIAEARRLLGLLEKGMPEYGNLAFDAIIRAAEHWAVVYNTSPIGLHKQYLEKRSEIGGLQWQIYSAIRWPRWPEPFTGDEEE